jgi:hypothetical protein
MQQPFIDNEEDAPLRAFDLVFSMNVTVDRSLLQVSPYLFVCTMMVKFL